MKLAFMWIDPQVSLGHAVTGLRGQFGQVVHLLLEHGYDAVEVMLGDPFLFDLDEVSTVVRKTGIDVIQLCTGEYYGSYAVCLNHPDREVRNRARAWGERTVKLADIMQCPVSVGRFRGGIWDDGRQCSMERMAESMVFLDKVAASRGVEVLLEPLRKEICSTLNSVEETVGFITQNALDATAMMLDTDHTAIENEEPAIRNNHSAVGVVHLADSGHQPLGCGSVRFDRYFEVLAEIGYGGPLSVEVFPRDNGGEILASSVEYLRQFITRDEERGVWQWL